MTWHMRYNAMAIIKHDEDIIDVLRESYYIIFSEGVFNRFILKFL